MKLVVRCYQHPNYTGLSTPPRLNDDVECEACALVQKARGALFTIRVPPLQKPHDPPEVGIRWGAW